MKWGGYYRDGFEDFQKQVVLMFPDLHFSQIKIWLTAPTTPTAKPTLEDAETDKEVVVTDKLGRVADNSVNPLVQTDNPPTGL